LDNDYFQEFELGHIEEHIRLFQTIGPSRPYALKLEALGNRIYGMTVLSLDYPGLLAVLTGLLSGLGYQIRTARVFTCGAMPEAGIPQDHIIDFLVLEHEDGASQEVDPGESIREGLDALYRNLGGQDRQSLYEDVITRLMKAPPPPGTWENAGLPLEVRFENLPDATQMRVLGKSRRATLFSISLATSLQTLSIQKLTTEGEGDEFDDRFTLVNAKGGPLLIPSETDPLRAAILLMERFLWSLREASDIALALKGMRRIVTAWLPGSASIAENFQGGLPFFPALAKVLSAGPHLWDEVLAMGPEAFKSILDELQSRDDNASREKIKAGIEKAWLGKPAEEAFSALVRFRSHARLKIELAFLFDPEARIAPMSEKLTALADETLSACLERIIADFEAKHGRAGAYGFFALGKYGSGEMGSGSDLEVLLMHEESGNTASDTQPLRQGEFFSQVATRLQNLWCAPYGVTFALDWRLRPHGESGPMAAYFESWRNYLRPGGGALEYEIQAHLRLRPICGSQVFIEKVLRERDEIVFREPPLPIDHTLRLRDQQIQLKTKSGIFNTKFSPGAMVDIEYAVQFLQLRHGLQYPQVRQISTAKALEGLLEVGIISLAEFEQLYTSFLFLRRLQGHLRLSRGLAKDLNMPLPNSPEYRHLAKRLGYLEKTGMPAETRLENDVKRCRSAVAGFMDYRFKGQPKPRIFDFSLSQNLMDESCSVNEAEPALRRMGMSDYPKAQELFLELFALVLEKRLLAAALLLAEDRFYKSPDPEYILLCLIRYLKAIEYPDLTVRQFLHHPPLLHSLLTLFGHSRYLGERVIRDPAGIKSILQNGRLYEPIHADSLMREAAAWVGPDRAGTDLATSLCRFRDREYLRIALRDIYLHAHLQPTTRDISALSDALISLAIDSAFQPMRAKFPELEWALIGMGKLGGRELNYSSDIDLIFIRADDAESEAVLLFDQCAKELIGILSAPTSSGTLFRVDMNLRPWGRQGYLTGTSRQYLRYYREEAHGWELQAWLKARSLGGHGGLGDHFIQTLHAWILDPQRRDAIEISMRKVRKTALEILAKENRLAGEVKLGPGGIRTVEFFVQALQIRHGHDLPEIVTGNTLEALGRLQHFHLLTPNQYQTLAKAYVFLRRIEHRLQLSELRQVHELPKESAAMGKLAKRMGFEARFGQSASSLFLDQYRRHMLTLLSVSEQLFQY